MKVTNIGDTYAGKEVVQIYASLPQTEVKKEYRRLVGQKKNCGKRTNAEKQQQITAIVLFLHRIQKRKKYTDQLMPRNR